MESEREDAILARDDLPRIEQAIMIVWGDRCPDFNEDCPICQAWGEYDALNRGGDDAK